MDGARGKLQVVEIRIHGVGGEPASSLLDHPHPLRIVGDDISGFYVAGAVESATPSPATGKHQMDIPERLRQALAWGGNTSGSWKNALWILLLPFALLNVSGYMHKPGIRPTRRVRWLSLTLTLSAVALASATAYDLIALQCGSSPGCVRRVRWLAPYDWELSGVPLFLDNPARRLGLATVLPMGLLGLLWFAGRYAYKDLESYLSKRLNDGPDAGEGLIDRGFWNGYETAFRARLIHLAAGRSLIAGSLAWALYNLADERAWKSPAGWTLWIAAAVLAGCVAACVWPVVYQSGANAGAKLVLGCLQILSWAVLGAALGLAAAFAPWPKPVLLALALVLFGLAIANTALAASEVRRQVRDSSEEGLDEPAQAPKRPGYPFSVLPLVAGVLAGMALFPGRFVPEATLSSSAMFDRLFAAPYQLAWGIGTFQLILVLALLIGRFSPQDTRRQARGTPFGPHWKQSSDLKRNPLYGRGSAVFGILAIFIILAVAAGVHRGVANLVALDPERRALLPPATADLVAPTANAVTLNSSSGVGLAGEPPELIQATIPWWYETTAHVLVLLILGLVVSSWRFKRGLNRKPTDEHLEEVRAHVSMDPDFAMPIDLNDGDDRARLVNVFKGWAMSRELVRADNKLFWTTLTVGILGLFLLLFQAPKGIGWVDGLREPLPQDMIGKPFGFAATASLWLVGTLPVLAVLILRAAAQKESWRRQIGRVWDVLMFWPRNVQPFAPPCYAERVVPQLRLHIDRLHEQGRSVIVAGHSQGSVIAAAAVSIGPLSDDAAVDGASRATEDAEGRKVGAAPSKRRLLDLVVYGSPISILYERYFPAYFGKRFFAKVTREADHWHHLFARTDVFAFPFWEAQPGDVSRPCEICGYPEAPQAAQGAAADHTDYIVVDPLLWDGPSREPPRPPIRGHSTYATGDHQRFEEHMKTIARQMYEAQ